MPVAKALPYPWYNAPNVRLLIRRDFEQRCRRWHIDILQRMVLDYAHRPWWGRGSGPICSAKSPRIDRDALEGESLCLE